MSNHTTLFVLRDNVIFCGVPGFHFHAEDVVFNVSCTLYCDIKFILRDARESYTRRKFGGKIY